MKLKNVLHRRCVSQAELAAAAGVSPATISGVLNGTRNPSPKVKRKISAVLRIPPRVLFARSGR
jgi:transcriptional regulator with XRE-family HTH domain